jgi:hypothetical protein
MQQPDASEMRLERLHQVCGQHRHPVLCALAVAHYDLAVGKVEILHSERQALDLPKPRPVQQPDHQPRRPLERLEQPAHLGLGQHNRHSHRPLRPHQPRQPRQILAQHVLVQKEQRR